MSSFFLLISTVLHFKRTQRQEKTKTKSTDNHVLMERKWCGACQKERCCWLSNVDTTAIRERRAELKTEAARLRQLEMQGEK